MSVRGACLCGDIAYTYSGTVETLNLCLCGACRRAGGGIGQPVIVARREDVAFDAPPRVAEYASSPGKIRAFCPRCGAPVYSRREDLPGILRLRAGLMANLPEPTTIDVAFRADALRWLPRLAAQLEDAA